MIYLPKRYLRLTSSQRAGETLSVVDKAKVKVTRVLKNMSTYKSIPKKDIPEIVKKSTMNKKAITRMNGVKHFGVDKYITTWKDVDAHYMAQSSFMEKEKSIIPSLEKLQEIVKMIGFQGVNDMETEVSGEYIKTIAEKLVPKLNECAKKDGRRLRGNKKGNSITVDNQVIKALGRELRQVCFLKLETRTRQKRVNGKQTNYKFYKITYQKGAKEIMKLWDIQSQLPGDLLDNRKRKFKPVTTKARMKRQK